MTQRDQRGRKKDVRAAQTWSTLARLTNEANTHTHARALSPPSSDTTDDATHIPRHILCLFLLRFSASPSNHLRSQVFSQSGPFLPWRGVFQPSLCSWRSPSCRPLRRRRLKTFAMTRPTSLAQTSTRAVVKQPCRMLPSAALRATSPTSACAGASLELSARRSTDVRRRDHRRPISLIELATTRLPPLPILNPFYFSTQTYITTNPPARIMGYQ